MQVFSVFLGSALLVLAAVAAVVRGDAGPDPAKWLLHESGFFALVFLVASLGISPVSRLLRQPRIVLWRRPLGLAAFSFATAHVLIYVLLYQALDILSILEDVGERSYIVIGMIAWILLVPLAATSSRRARLHMGEHWRSLHKAVYLIVPLAVIHQAMAQKADFGETVVFSALVACFLIERAAFARGVSRSSRGG